MKVSRGSDKNGPDILTVSEDDGTVLLSVPIHPSGPLAPTSADDAKAHPWYYTGSPYGKEILDLYNKRNPSETHSDRLIRIAIQADEVKGVDLAKLPYDEVRKTLFGDN